MISVVLWYFFGGATQNYNSHFPVWIYIDLQDLLPNQNSQIQVQERKTLSECWKKFLGKFFDRMKSYENQSFQDVKMRQRCKICLAGCIILSPNFNLFAAKKDGLSFFPEPDSFQYVHKFCTSKPDFPNVFFFPFSSSKSRHAWSYWIGREGVSKMGRCGQGVNKTHFGSWKKNDQWNLELNRKMNWYDHLI